MPDNLSNYGIESDQPRRRGKKRRAGLKRFGVEYKMTNPQEKLGSLLHRLQLLDRWIVWGWYAKSVQRDQAIRGLRRKSKSFPWRLEYKYRAINR